MLSLAFGQKRFAAVEEYQYGTGIGPDEGIFSCSEGFIFHFFDACSLIWESVRRRAMVDGGNVHFSVCVDNFVNKSLAQQRCLYHASCVTGGALPGVDA